MRRYKNITAFLASLVIAFSAVSAYAPAVSADETTISASESTEDSGLKVSGSFSYSITHDNTVCIEDCTSTDKDLVVPAEIDGIAVTDLGMRAFGSTPDQVYETITLPDSLSYISSYNPFIYCPSLKEIKLGSGNKDYVLADGVLFTKDMKTLICYPPKKTGDSYTVPDGIEALATAAIYSTELSTINLPTSLKSVDDYALSTNHKLKAIDLSQTAVTDISLAFCADNIALTDVKFNSNTTKIGMGAFWGCEKLTDIEFPAGLQTIEQNAFMDTGLKTVHIPASVNTIGYCAFGYRSGTDGKEYADDDFTIIGTYYSGAYNYAHDSDAEYDYANNFVFMSEDEYASQQELLSLDKATENNYTYANIDGEAYIVQCNASDSDLTVPAELGGLPVRGALPTAFTTCSAEKITLPDGFRELREMSFYNCVYLKEAVLPQSLEKIGENCFDGCSNLETIDCGGASEIGAKAFNNCEALTAITISGNCKEFTGDTPYDTCTALEEINVKGGSGGAYSSKDGVLFDVSGDKLVEYPISRSGSVYKVPKGTKEISAYAFAGCSNLEDVVLPHSLETVGDYAFYGCSSLKKIRAYKELENIGKQSFGFDINPMYNYSEDVDQSIPVDGFKLYAPKNSKAYDYAKENDLEVVTGTIRIGNKNISIVMLAIIGGVIALAVVLLIVMIIRKKRSAAETVSAAKKKKGGDSGIKNAKKPEPDDKKDTKKSDPEKKKSTGKDQKK
ncbi:MAG: leucine-rich repeat protein [Ruminococcus sp.]|nr:leucine-rich repeat protein [Ruminococcus sp.]